MPPTDPPSHRRRRLLAAAIGCALPACRKAPGPDLSAESAAAPGADWLLTPGAPPPDWSLLDPWQGAVTREQFVRLLEEVLTDGTSWFAHVEIGEEAAHVRTATPRENLPRYELKFTPPGSTPASPGQRFWRRLEELPPLGDPARPLQDVHIVIDPGHIGGAWAQMEGRWYRSGDAPPVKEGDLTLRTARVLAPMLQSLGAKVSHLRTRPAPLTNVRPDQLMAAARASLVQEGKPVDSGALQAEAERLFYRAAEIRARGALVNDSLRPDLVLCLHYNAVTWGDPNHVVFSPVNHLHILAHGCIGDGEFVLDDQRLDGLLRLVQLVPDTEIPLCTAVARRMAETTGLPAFAYPGRSARMVNDQPYVWMRNLLANRIYRCPVVFLEPYVMNNRDVFDRIRAGHYEGTTSVAGQERASIFREYAAGVAAGLTDFFNDRRRA
jgi:N-acetylmuramoyl-L-alanine amidase